jgi:hypothetical protein
MASLAAAQRRWQRQRSSRGGCSVYPQNIVLPIPIIAIDCQLKIIAGLEKRQLIVVSPTII